MVNMMFNNGYPQNKQITYAGILWLLAAQLVVMAPLVFYLPLWILPVLVFSAGWRIRVIKGYATQPSNLTKILIAGLGIGALTFSGIKLISLDMMATLLLLGFAYKALEVIQRRDAMVVILTGFVLIGVLFLYSQSILTALYSIFALTVLTGAMIVIQQSQSHAIIPNLRLASLMLLLCLPLMLLFFIFAPRFSPLWAIPLASGHAKTGITDRMTPGDIATLSQSDALAFTANFSGERPKQAHLYWRGMILQHFDGNTWTPFAEEHSPEMLKSRLNTNKQAIKNRLIPLNKPEAQADALNYEVIYEKSAQSWLFALSPVVDIKGDAFFGADFQIMANSNLLEPMMLTLVSQPAALRDVELPEVSRQLALQLPAKGNSQSRELAQQLFTSSASPQAYIQKVLTRYQQHAFYYTLRPPILSKSNSIDDFLFQSQKGFCAHYAGSFVFMMRAAGIPARVITGYQGGEWNDNGGFLSVRQYDAHAWTEVWLKNQGWTRFDPTTMVAPERVEKNLEAAVNDEGSFLEDKTLSMTKFKGLDSLRKMLDSTQYAWRRFVLGYDSDQQAHFLEQLFGEITVQKIALIVGGLFAGILLLWVGFLGLIKKHTREAIEHQLYRHFCKQLAKHGIKRKASQTPDAFSQIASGQLPELAHEIKTFSKLYSRICYMPSKPSDQQDSIRNLKRLLKKIKRY
jgi:transglutaminase-like putative cysteine protease